MTLQELTRLGIRARPGRVFGFSITKHDSEPLQAEKTAYAGAVSVQFTGRTGKGGLRAHEKKPVHAS